MARFTFAQEQDIRRIAASVLASERQMRNAIAPAMRKTPQALDTYVGRVNNSGQIDAISGSTPGKGTVDVYKMTGDTAGVTDPLYSVDAYNYSSDAVADSSWVTLTRDPYSGNWVIGISGSGTAYTYIGKAGATITGRSGTTISSGSCTIYQNVGGTLTDAGLSPVTAYNIQDDDIANGQYVILIYDLPGATWFAMDPDGSGATETAVGTVDESGGIAGRSGATVTTGTVNVFGNVGGTLTDTTDDVDAYNFGTAALAQNDWVVLLYDTPGSSWYCFAPGTGGTSDTRIGQVDEGAGIAGRSGATVTAGTIDVQEISGGTITATVDEIEAYNVQESALVDDAYVLTIWDPIGEQWVCFNPDGNGMVKVDSADDLDYLEDQMADWETVAYSATKHELVYHTKVAETGDDKIRGYVLGGRVMVSSTDSLDYLEDQFADKTASAYDSDTDGAHIQAYSDGLELTLYLPFNQIYGWVGGNDQVLTHDSAGMIQWQDIDSLGTQVTAVTDVDFIDPDYQLKNRTIRVLDAGDKSDWTTWVTGTDC